MLSIYMYMSTYVEKTTYESGREQQHDDACVGLLLVGLVQLVHGPAHLLHVVRHRLRLQDHALVSQAAKQRSKGILNTITNTTIFCC